MAMEALLKLDGVDGESQRQGYEGQIQLDSFSWGAQNSSSPVGQGAGAGTVEISDFTVTKKTDLASAKLFQACCSGNHFDQATLTIIKPGGDSPVEYLVYDFTGLYITGINWSGASGGDDTPSESVSFAFGTVQVTYTPQNADGTAGSPLVAGWDRNTQQPVGGS